MGDRGQREVEWDDVGQILRIPIDGEWATRDFARLFLAIDTLFWQCQVVAWSLADEEARERQESLSETLNVVLTTAAFDRGEVAERLAIARGVELGVRRIGFGSPGDLLVQLKDRADEMMPWIRIGYGIFLALVTRVTAAQERGDRLSLERERLDLERDQVRLERERILLEAMSPLHRDQAATAAWARLIEPYIGPPLDVIADGVNQQRLGEAGLVAEDEANPPRPDDGTN